MAAVRFRTQDSRASWAKKLNTMLDPLNILLFREVPQTYEQWQHKLNAAVKAAVAAHYPSGTLHFRLGEPRNVWARKLNRLSAAIEAGPVTP